jgi:hypothetical protein
MLTGYKDSLPADVLLDMGILLKGTTKIGVTEGAPEWDPGVDLAEVAFDGKRVKHVKGLTRRVMFDPTIKATLKEFGGAATGGQIALVEPGSSATTDPGPPAVTTITPKSASGFFADGDYITDLRLIFERGNGKFAAIHFPLALCTKYALKGSDTKEVTYSVEFHAVGNPSGDLSLAPYLIELRDALPTA